MIILLISLKVGPNIYINALIMSKVPIKISDLTEEYSRTKDQSIESNHPSFD